MPRERINRLVPVDSMVSMAELTGPQRIEARMLDRLSLVLIRLPQFNGPEGAKRLTNFFGGVSSVADFEERFRQSYGASSLVRFKEMVVEHCGDLTGFAPESSEAVVRMNLVAWAKTPVEGERSISPVGGNWTRSEPVADLGPALVGKSKSNDNGWKQVTKAGLPKGPGTYRGMSKAERLRKRRRGQFRSGNGHK